MAPRRLSDSQWAALREAWLCGEDSAAGLARRHRVHVSTLYAAAKRLGWPPRGSARDDELPGRQDAHALAARQLYEDLMTELRQGLERLRKDEETAEDARDRAALIRAHRRALAVLLETGAPAAGDALGPELDLEKARAEVLRRLDRLAAPETRDGE